MMRVADIHRGFPMRKLTIAALFASAVLAVPAVAQAQDASTTTTTTTTQTTGDTATAPDGSRPFGLEPYFGVMGGYERFDNEATRAGIPRALNANGTVRNNYELAGGLVEGVLGANIPLGPVFVGAEGTVAKGFTGNIDWEYGAAGRAGFRAGDSGLFYGKVGYKWINFDHFSGRSTLGADTNHDYKGWEYGIGFEAGPKDIGLGGLTGRAGVRLRGEVSTFQNFHSIRPMLGVITHF
jgi:outer membrane immunogenic protein